MVKIREAIVVEGKYDKNTLSQIVDAPILQTNGFGILKDKAQLQLLRRVAKERGIIIFTDSDGAGFVIRNHLKSAIPGAFLKHAYIPDIYGKERRKNAPGKEGKLGVEGMRPEVILEALRRAGATFERETKPQPPQSKAGVPQSGLMWSRDQGWVKRSRASGPCLCTALSLHFRCDHKAVEPCSPDKVKGPYSAGAQPLSLSASDCNIILLFVQLLTGLS